MLSDRILHKWSSETFWNRGKLTNQPSPGRMTNSQLFFMPLSWFIYLLHGTANSSTKYRYTLHSKGHPVLPFKQLAAVPDSDVVWLSFCFFIYSCTENTSVYTVSERSLFFTKHFFVAVMAALRKQDLPVKLGYPLSCGLLLFWGSGQFLCGHGQMASCSWQLPLTIALF